LPAAVAVVVLQMETADLVVVDLVVLLFIQEDHFLLQHLIQSLLDLVVLVLMVLMEWQQLLMVEIPL